ncbi:MAG: ABC transporter permease [Verrucomicrobia bacterium]|nr:MAG: ABC transporter permease [Verrucomicrobiota bacterium]
MSAEANTASIARSTTQPMYWSVLRELWENKSIYIAPMIVSGVILLGALISAGHLPERRRNAMILDEARRRAAIELPYDIVAMMLILTAFIVGFFYCLDALYGERRDRSILFWKSLPVSDLTTVLSKAIVTLAILPVVIFVVAVVTQFILLLLSSAVLAPSGLAATTWQNFNLLRESVVLFYGLIVIALWHAPIYGWALLVSGIARRATFLWAVLPPLAIGIFEKITFNTSYFASMLKNRLLDLGSTAFDFQMHRSISVDLSQLTPGRFLATPGLWIGLIVAAGFIIAAVQLRRYRGPI